MTRLLLLLVAFIITPNVRAQEVSPAENPDVAAAITHFETGVEAQRNHRGLPGLSIGIVSEQKLVWRKEFGYANVENKEPVTRNTVFRLGSLTKLFIATAIMKLREKGKLSLEDSVESHLPWFKIPGYAPAIAPITIRQLLIHTSGLPMDAPFPYWDDSKFPTIDEIKTALPSQQTAFTPGTKWKYSNLGYVLLGEVISKTSGVPFETYVQDDVIKPLKMEHTSIAITAEMKKHLAVGYGRSIPGRQREKRPFTDAKGLSAAANLTSNVEDLARFVAFQFMSPFT